MAAPAGFSDLINRKYDILSQEATDRGELLRAQAGSIAASTPFENALKAAQTRQTTETAKTIGPLAQASQAATYAGIGETQARTGLFGAQAAQTGAQTQRITQDIGELGARYYLDQLRKMGSPFAPSAAGSPITQSVLSSPATPAAAPAAPTATPGVPPPATAAGQIGFGQQSGYYDENGNYVAGLAKGTAMVKSSGKPAGGVGGFAGMLEAAKGASRVPGRGSGKVDKVPAVLAPGEAVVNAAGVKHIPGGRAAIAKANAKGAKELGLGGRGKAKGAPPPRATPHFVPGAPVQQAAPVSKRMV